MKVVDWHDGSVNWEAFDQAYAAFTAHLDRCRQCRDNPMFMCLVGAALLRKAAEATGELPGK